MLQTDLNKRLYEAIKGNVGFVFVYLCPRVLDAASACEKIVLQQKIDLLNELQTRLYISPSKVEFTWDLKLFIDSLKNN